MKKISPNQVKLYAKKETGEVWLQYKDYYLDIHIDELIEGALKKPKLRKVMSTHMDRFKEIVLEECKKHFADQYNSMQK